MNQQSITWSIDGTIITVNGTLDGPGAEGLAAAMSSNLNYVCDFTNVSEAKFSGLRALLNLRKKGHKFCIINANDQVAERFEDTGVSSIISICRKPKQLDMGKYTMFGSSFLSKAYNSADGDSMIKVYGENMPRWIVAKEKSVARAVMLFGLPTPLVGTLYEKDGHTALDFERIEGKRSLARVISEQPERLEEIARKFAQMCKELHSTPCDTQVFSDRSVVFRQAVVNSKDISPDVRDKALALLDSLPPSTTCLHGDLHIGNVITNEKEYLWIDLSDFSYGNPMLDLGMWYFQSKAVEEKIAQEIYHITKAQALQVWEYFIDEYFDAKTPEQKEEVDKMVRPFCALQMIYLGSTYGKIFPWMIEFIGKVFK